jgi:hypothetical protein
MLMDDPVLAMTLGSLPLLQFSVLGISFSEEYILRINIVLFSSITGAKLMETT